MLDGKVAFITGGSSGIGAASAKKLTEEGARVAIVARHRGSLEAVVEKLDGVALPLEVDVSDADAVKRAIDRTVEHFDGLDVVLANAGINGKWAPIEELEEDDWRKTLSTNLDGSFYTIKHAVPHLKRRGGGSIVVMSSINGTRTFSLSGATAYATSKAGQLAMAKMLALELAPDNIRVNVICPGQIATAINESTDPEDLDEIRFPVDYPEGKVPLSGGGPAAPEEVAELVAFLASERSRFITGTPVWIDGGQSLFMG